MSVSSDQTNDQLRHSAEFRRAGYWDDTTLPHFIERWSDQDPSHRYLSDGVSEYTYGEFRESAWNLAAALLELGVGRGDRVAVQLPNWNEYFLVYAACARVQAVMIPIVPVYRESEVRFIVENAQAVGLITSGTFHAAMARDIAKAVPSIAFRIVVRGEPDGAALGLDTILSTGRDHGELPALPGSDDRHLILYSSGTESHPKGCLHTWNTSSFLPKQAVAALEMGRSDVMFMPSPVTHALGLTLGVMAPTVAGASVHLLDIFDPAVALDRMSTYQCTGVASPAPFIRMILDAFDPEKHDVPSLRFWLSTIL